MSSIDLSEYTPNVDNQKSEPICYAMAVADMVGTCYRIKYGGELVLSPQSLIDAGCNTDAILILLDPLRGLQRIQDYPVRRSSKRGVGVQYNKKAPRYTIARGYTGAASKEIITAMFGGGRVDNPYPMVGAMKLGRLEDDDFAYDCFMSSRPFKHSTDLNYQEELKKQIWHAVLIVGYCSLALNPEEHHCIIKNTHGERWGYHGLSKVSCEVFVELRVVDEI